MIARANLRAVGVIPARMGSSRFPGKPLKDILGISMLEHVFRRTALAESLSEVAVATCDAEIKEAAESFGARALMTSSEHERATDRVAEAAEVIAADLYVMVQGDEPLVTPGMIQASIEPFYESEQLGCVNLMKRIESEEEYRDPNTVKVVPDLKGRALYYSRAPIPTPDLLGWPAIQGYKQVCVIPFRSERLRAYARLAPTPSEEAESIDMLRFLEHGFPVHLVETDVVTQAVDTPTDRDRVEELLRGDGLTARYLDTTETSDE